jgi:hypothetical protein
MPQRSSCCNIQWVDKGISEDFGISYSFVSVDFTDGSHYEYHNMPRVVFDRWASSGDIGRFFNRFIRGNYT